LISPVYQLDKVIKPKQDNRLDLTEGGKKIKAKK
jgi:hypothetical protein